MVRINVGINPRLLTDQHLLAEHVEILMLVSKFRNDGFIINNIPSQFTLGTGHINFFKNKLTYLCNRYSSIMTEMLARNFNASEYIQVASIIESAPKSLLNNYYPTLKDSMMVRERIIDKIKAKKGWYRYYGSDEFDQNLYFDCLLKSEVYE